MHKIPVFKDNKQVYIHEVERPVDEGELELSERPLYERYPDENDYDFYVFTVFRDLHPEVRTIKAAAVKLNLDYGRLRARASRFNWQARAEAWDDECDRIARETHLDTIREMNERHARNSANLQSMLMLPAGILSKKIKDGGVASFEGMSVAKLFELIVKVSNAYPNIAKLERTAQGEADEIKKHELTLEANVNIKEVRYNVVHTESRQEVAQPQTN